jgi:hypothetical protein
MYFALDASVTAPLAQGPHARWLRLPAMRLEIWKRQRRSLLLHNVVALDRKAQLPAKGPLDYVFNINGSDFCGLHVATYQSMLSNWRPR